MDSAVVELVDGREEEVLFLVPFFLLVFRPTFFGGIVDSFRGWRWRSYLEREARDERD